MGDVSRAAGDLPILHPGILEVGVDAHVHHDLARRHVLSGYRALMTCGHHEDVRSAARIAILGMLKNNHLNQLLADIVISRNTDSTYKHYVD